MAREDYVAGVFLYVSDFSQDFHRDVCVDGFSKITLLFYTRLDLYSIINYVSSLQAPKALRITGPWAIFLAGASIIMELDGKYARKIIFSFLFNFFRRFSAKDVELFRRVGFSFFNFLFKNPRSDMIEQRQSKSD